MRPKTKGRGSFSGVARMHWLSSEVPVFSVWPYANHQVNAVPSLFPSVLAKLALLSGVEYCFPSLESSFTEGS